MTSNQAFQSRGQKRRRSTTWRGVRRGVQHFPEKFPIHLERCRISWKNNNWGSIKTTISGLLSKTKYEEKVCELWIKPGRFSFVHLIFHFLDMFFNVLFSDVFFCDFFWDVFSRPFPMNLELHWTKVILVPTASQGISDTLEKLL